MASRRPTVWERSALEIAADGGLGGGRSDRAAGEASDAVTPHASARQTKGAPCIFLKRSSRKNGPPMPPGAPWLGARAATHRQDLCVGLEQRAAQPSAASWRARPRPGVGLYLAPALAGHRPMPI